MVSPTEGWITGGITDPAHPHDAQYEVPLIMHFFNCHWTQVHFALPGLTLFDLDMLSPNDGWAMGDNNLVGPLSRAAVVRYHAGQWQVVPTPLPAGAHGKATVEYNNMIMTSPEDGWIVAQFEGGADTFNYVLRLQHGVWSVASDAFAQAVWQLNGAVIQGGTVWGYGATGLHLNTGGGKPYPVIGRYVDGTWQPAHLTTALSGLTGSITSMSALATNDIWAVGQAPYGGNNADYRPLVLHYDGNSWSQVTLPDGMQGKPWSTDLLVMVSSHEGWIWGKDYSRDQQLGELLLLHYLNGSWQRVTALPKNLSAGVQSPAFGGEAWGIGYYDVGSCINTCYVGETETRALLHLYHGQWQITGRIPQNPNA
jgi:hypothetical protein